MQATRGRRDRNRIWPADAAAEWLHDLAIGVFVRREGDHARVRSGQLDQPAAALAPWSCVVASDGRLSLTQCLLRVGVDLVEMAPVAADRRADLRQIKYVERACLRLGPPAPQMPVLSRLASATRERPTPPTPSLVSVIGTGAGLISRAGWLHLPSEAVAAGAALCARP